MNRRLNVTSVYYDYCAYIDYLPICLSLWFVVDVKLHSSNQSIKQSLYQSINQAIYSDPSEQSIRPASKHLISIALCHNCAHCSTAGNKLCTVEREVSLHCNTQSSWGPQSSYWYTRCRCNVLPYCGSCRCNVLPCCGSCHCSVLPCCGSCHCNVLPCCGSCHCNVLPCCGSCHCNVLPCCGSGHCNVLPCCGSGHCNVLPCCVSSRCNVLPCCVQC